MTGHRRMVEQAGGILAGILLAGVCLGGTVDGRLEPEAALTAGRAALADGLYGIAARRFREVLDADADAVAAGEVLDLLLASYRGAGAWDRIEVLLDSPAATALDADGMAWWRALLAFQAREDAAVLELLTPLLEREAPGPFTVRALRLAGWAHERAGRPDAAAALFRRYDERMRDDPVSQADNLLDLGRVLQAAGQPEAATNVFARLMAEAPDAARRARARYELGRGQREGGRLVAAAATLTPLVEDASLPDDFRALAGLELAVAQAGVEGPEAAVDVLETCLPLAARPVTRAAVQRLLGEFLIRAGRVAEGIPLLQGFVSEFTDDVRAPAIQLRIGRVLLETGDWTAAAAAYRRYLEAFESRGADLAVAYEGRGLALIGLGRYSEASDTLLRAFELTPDSFPRERTLLKAAEALVAAGRFGAAQEQFERLLALPPAHHAPDAIRLRIADCLAARDQVDEAIALLGELADAAEESHAIAALLLRAALQADRRQWEAAEYTYNDLLARAVDDADMAAGLYGRGLARYHLWKPEASNDFEALRDQFPGSAYAEKALYMRALSQFRLGRDEQSLAAARAFLDDFPQSDYAPLVRFWMAEVQYNRGDYPDGEARFLAFASEHPAHAQVDEALFRAGLAAYRQNEFLRANAHFGQLFSSLPDSARIPDARYAQADALIQLGRFAEAILILDEVIKRYPGHPVVPLAWLSKGDCQFALGSEDAARYDESIRSYRVVTHADGLRPGIRLQAEYKIGRSLQKLDRRQDALDQYYTRVMVPFLDRLNGAEPVSEADSLWFTRAALNAAEVLEARQDWRQLVRVLDRVGQTRVAIAEEARRRSRTVRAEYWWLFY